MIIIYFLLDFKKFFLLVLFFFFPIKAVLGKIHDYHNCSDLHYSIHFTPIHELLNIESLSNIITIVVVAVDH